MINKLVIENLKHRWVRTLGSAMIVGILVASLITLIGLSRGMLEESASRARGIGADIVLRKDTEPRFPCKRDRSTRNSWPQCAPSPTSPKR